MKKLFTAAVVALVALTGCQNSEEADKQAQQQKLQEATKEELIKAVAERDELLSLLGDISTDVQEMRRLEQLMMVNDGNETPDRRQQLRNDLAVIQQALQNRRERLAELEAKLRTSNTANQRLHNTITQLRAQLDEQSHEIERLNGRLAQARSEVSRLNEANDSLATAVDVTAGERDAAIDSNVALTNELNTVYYVIATDKELKQHGIVQKKKVLLGDYDQSFFVTADKRNLRTLPLHTTKKVEILTPMPNGSYTITEDANKAKVLNITDPDAFWRQSPYLVVKVK